MSLQRRPCWCWLSQRPFGRQQLQPRGAPAARGHCQRGLGHQLTLAGAGPGQVLSAREGPGCREAGRESLPLRAPRHVPRQQASLERGWFGRDAWREVHARPMLSAPGVRSLEGRDTGAGKKGTEVQTGPCAPSPCSPAGAAWGPVTCQGTPVRGLSLWVGRFASETGSVGVQPQEGKQAPAGTGPPLPRKCGCVPPLAKESHGSRRAVSPGPSQGQRC